MKTYRSLANWLVQHGHQDVLYQIIEESQTHIRTLERTSPWLIIFTDQVKEHLYTGMLSDHEKPFGSAGNLGAFFDVWLFLDCPGLDDEAVVRILRKTSLWNEFFGEQKPFNLSSP